MTTMQQKRIEQLQTRVDELLEAVSRMHSEKERLDIWLTACGDVAEGRCIPKRGTSSWCLSIEKVAELRRKKERAEADLAAMTKLRDQWETSSEGAMRGHQESLGYADDLHKQLAAMTGQAERRLQIIRNCFLSADDSWEGNGFDDWDDWCELARDEIDGDLAERILADEGDKAIPFDEVRRELGLDADEKKTNRDRTA